MDEIQQHNNDINEYTEQNMKKSHKFGKGVLVGVLSTLAVVLLVLIGGTIYLKQMGFGSLEGLDTTKMEYIVSLIRYYFYEDVDEEALSEGVYKGLMESLDDPYSVYYTAEEYDELMIDTTGNYAGIGAVLTKSTEDDSVMVVTVYEGSPAEQAGLRSGDVIISADDVVAKDEDLDIFVRSVRGEEGSVVTIVYERDGVQTSVDVTRAQVSVPSVSYQMLDGNIGYVYISEFSSNTKEQYDAAMADLTSQGMQAVIFDLRYNGGGLVDSVTDILDEILPEGTTVYMEDKRGERTTYTSDAEHYLDMPIAVLISENTASAAEIFAGAIRDFDYGTLIGTTTFGKGIVQSTIPLSDGSAIKITMATYYTPSGECIHKVGIDPDVELEYEFLGGDEDTYDTSLDNQIVKAMEVLGNTD
jgi:carboxyl-terminal processing protease